MGAEITYPLDLPHEVLHHILTEVDPADLGALSCCCHKFNVFIKTNRLLYKELYLKQWDDPQIEKKGAEFEWRTELEKVVKLKRVLESKDVEFKKQSIPLVVKSVENLLKTAKISDSLNLEFIRELLHDENKDLLLHQSTLHEWMDSPRYFTYATPSGLANSNKQLSAQLRCLYGVTEDDMATSLHSKRDTHITHPYARSRVYDLRYYSEDTFWGPFHDDGSENVDWEKAEAILIVISHNLHIFSQHHSHSFAETAFQRLSEKAFVGAAPNSFVSKPRTEGMEPVSALDALDPFGVGGTYMRVVCFLDYTDLYSFNFHNEVNDIHQPRRPIDTEEATRLIVMRLRVSKIQTVGDDGEKLDWPIVHFRGTSSSMRPSWDPDANSKIRGTVRKTAEGEVRWTSWSIFHGEERWRSEGVQIGGAKSARGVIGTWFDKDYDVHGPAGPTAFWKTHDGIEEPPVAFKSGWL